MRIPKNSIRKTNPHLKNLSDDEVVRYLSDSIVSSFEVEGIKIENPNITWEDIDKNGKMRERSERARRKLERNKKLWE